MYMNINRFNKRKWFHIEKHKKQMIFCKNYDGHKLHRWSRASRKWTSSSLEQEAGGIGLHIDANKTEFMRFKGELLYSRNTNISRNKIKHNIRTSMNERIHF